MKLSTPKLRLLVGSVACVVASIASGTAHAEWPRDKPIRIVMPYSAGGSGDAAIRALQPNIEKALGGATLLINNKPGAAGNIGAADVARSAADGYTFLLGATNNFVMNQYLYKSSFEPLEKLTPVGLVVSSPLVFLVPTSSPASTLQEFMADAKKNTGKMNFGSPGIGTAPHLAFVRYLELTGEKMQHIPYQGTPPMTQALVAGEIQAVLVTADSTSGFASTAN